MDDAVTEGSQLVSVEILWPLEVIVKGTPVSLAGSSQSIKAWRQHIQDAIRPNLPEGHFAAEGPVQVTVYFFAVDPVRFDIDNIVKPIFDAMKQLVFVDDRQVERLVVQKFEPHRPFTFASASAVLADAAQAVGPHIYLAIKESEAGEVVP
jgi:crossover junction endodeoxyribonuclease RusA